MRRYPTKPSAPRRAVRCAILCALAGPAAAQAATGQSDPGDGPTGVLTTVVVTATRTAQDSQDLPVSVDRIDGATLHAGQSQVNLSESLDTVPGMSVQSRQNYAQDLQISSRGFGARSSFGVRGVRLYRTASRNDAGWPGAVLAVRPG